MAKIKSAAKKGTLLRRKILRDGVARVLREKRLCVVITGDTIPWAGGALDGFGVAELKRVDLNLEMERLSLARA